MIEPRCASCGHPEQAHRVFKGRCVTDIATLKRVYQVRERCECAEFVAVVS